jgi:hypothetical protein
MAAAEATIGALGTLARERTRRESRRLHEAPKQDRNDSPLLHPSAGDALLMAARALAADGPEPVAVVLADGTVRSLQERDPAIPHTVGRVKGTDWTLWWERRRWSEA